MTDDSTNTGTPPEATSEAVQPQEAAPFDEHAYRLHCFDHYPRRDYNLLTMAAGAGLPSPAVCRPAERMVMWNYEGKFGSVWMIHRHEANGQFALQGGSSWHDDPFNDSGNGWSFIWYRPYVLDCRRRFRQFMKWRAIVDEPREKMLPLFTANERRTTKP